MLHINATRLMNNLNALAEIGATPSGGVSRPALSEADVAGRKWFKARVAAAGFQPRMDGAGNLSVVLPAKDPAAKTLLFGSHLDSVPDGGRYDGPVGVLAAWEALQTIQEAGISPALHLELISFTDEEGANIGLLGSMALSGQLDAAAIAQPRGGIEQLQAGMARVGITPESILQARRDPATLAGYLEIHIEQGTRLESAGIDIGVVTGLVGIRSFRLIFSGAAAHAGTMPMNQRQDALWGAADFIRQAPALVQAQFSPGVMNCGWIKARPGAFNIVPGEVTLALEFRHGSRQDMDAMESALLSLAQDCAAAHGLGFRAEANSHQVSPALMSDTMIHAFEQAAASLGLSTTRLMSFAAHDTQAMSTITPSGMCFIPSVKGISHNPQEYSHDEDVINGANLLLHAILAFLHGPQ